jgi:uncharacterized protein (TIGR03435 family)
MGIRIIVLGATLLAGSIAAQTFDVASVKPNKTNDPPYSNFPLGPGDVYVQNGGLFSATGLPLVVYLLFAYKLIGSQAQSLLPQLPDWTKTEQFDIQARADGNPGKDQMRMMMRALLAERFKLKMHTESRDATVLAFVLVKPGKTGPQLQLHPADAPCETNAPANGAGPQTTTGGFPLYCNGIFGMTPGVPGRLRIGARNITLKFLAESLSTGASQGRPMVDQTGIDGTVDFLLEFTPELVGPQPPGATFQPDPSGPTLDQALRDQLGIKLESTKMKMDALVLDHVERPSEN